MWYASMYVCMYGTMKYPNVTRRSKKRFQLLITFQFSGLYKTYQELYYNN